MKVTEAQKNFRKQLEEAEREKIVHRIDQLKNQKATDEESFDKIEAEIKMYEKQLKKLKKKYGRFNIGKAVATTLGVLIALGFFVSIYAQESADAYDISADGNEAVISNEMLNKFYRVKRELSRTLSFGDREFRQKNVVAEYINIQKPMKLRRNQAIEFLDSDDYYDMSDEACIAEIDKHIKIMMEDIQSLGNIVPPKAMDKHFRYVRDMFDSTIEYFEACKALHVHGYSESLSMAYDEAYDKMSNDIDRVEEEFINVFDEIDMEYYVDDNGTVHYSYDDFE